MFDRYTQSALQVLGVAKEQAARLGSASIESEHLLLGIMRSCEPELDEILKVKDLEGVFRTELPATDHEDVNPAQVMPLSNQSKRILAYAAEEALRLSSAEISTGHLLLGVLREPESVGARFMVIRNIDMRLVRLTMTTLSRSQAAVARRSSSSPMGWAGTVKQRFWVGRAGQIAALILLGIGMAKSNVAGRHLLEIAAIWFVAALAWNKLGPFSFFLRSTKRNRAILSAITYAFIWLYQLFLFGWLLPLSVGIYRVALR